MRAVGFAILSTLFAFATWADVIDLSRVRIVCASLRQNLGVADSFAGWPSECPLAEVSRRIAGPFLAATLNERIEAYVLSNGFTKADVETLRRILLEPKRKASGK